MRITEKVTNILKAVPATRNSDKELIIIYMQKHGVRLSAFQIDKIRSMPSFETIRRVRQSVQENGDLRADPATEEARYEKFKNTKGMIGLSDAKTAEELLEARGYTIVND